MLSWVSTGTTLLYSSKAKLTPGINDKRGGMYNIAVYFYDLYNALVNGWKTLNI